MNMNEKLWKEFLKTPQAKKEQETLGESVVAVMDEVLWEQDASSPSADELKKFLRGKGYSDENFKHVKSSAYVTKFFLLVPLSREDRRALSVQMKNELERLGFIYDHTRDGPGRFDNIEGPRDKVYFLIKPSGQARSRPSDAGEQYEKDLETSLGEFLSGKFDVKTAGFGHGSDIVLTSKNGETNLSIEVKTSVGADFGQGTARYDLATNEWEINQTIQMKNNPDKLILFQSALDKLKEQGNTPSFVTLDQKGIGINSEEYGDVYIKKEVEGIEYAFGLKRSAKTPDLARAMRNAWFGSKESLYIPYDISTITKYYASKGDNLIQIKGYGLYSLSEEWATKLGIPLFGEGLEARIRFRIKPHHGKYERHSFTLANTVKGRIEPTTMDLDDISSLKPLMNVLG